MGLRAPRLPGQSLCMDAALPALPARPGRAPQAQTLCSRLRHRAPRCRLTFISPRGCATSCAFLLRSERLPPATACILGGPAAPCAGWTRICPAGRPGQSHPVGRTLRSALRFPRGAGLPAPSPRRPSGGGQPSSPPAPLPRGPAGFGVCHVVSISVSPRLSGQNTCLCLRVPVYSAPGWGGTSMGPSVLLSSAAGRCSWGRPPEPALGEGANFSLRSKMSTRWSWSFGGEFLQRDMVRSEQPQPGGVFSERGPDLASPLAGKRAFVTEPRDAHYRGSENTEIHKE